MDGTTSGVATFDHAVVIAGGGPTGLMLAGELALAGIETLIVERRTTHDVDGSRAGGLHARTIEVLDQRGIAERFLAAGRAMQIQGFAGIRLDISDFPTRHNYGLALWQREFEPMLAAWVLDELGVPIRRGCELVGFIQDGDGVDVELSDGTSLRTAYLVGCDGGRSTVRRSAGIDFPGTDPSTSWIVAEVELREQPPIGMRREGGGIGPVQRADDDGHGVAGGDREDRGEGDGSGSVGLFGVVLTERPAVQDREPTLQDLRDALVAAYGSDFGAHRPTRVSRFTDMTRQAATYRRGRVLLAGDAAHVHPPQGGQGLNTGVQDAVNLGWKLAQVVRGTSPQRLLDTYHAERHPVGARVLHNTRAQVALAQADERHDALRDILADLLQMDEPRRSIAGMMCALDVHYETGGQVDAAGAVDAGGDDAAGVSDAGRAGEGGAVRSGGGAPGEGAGRPAVHPLVGRRMPDLDLVTPDGATRVFALLHEARPVLLVLADTAEVDITPWADRVRRVDAVEPARAHGTAPRGTWELPVIGSVPAVPVVLIRPDGHVAWCGTSADPGIQASLTSWFGPPR